MEQSKQLHIFELLLLLFSCIYIIGFSITGASRFFELSPACLVDLLLDWSIGCCDLL